MKNKKAIKKILSFALTVIVCFSLSTLSMAKETNSSDNAPGNRMWASGTYSVSSGSTLATSSFNIPDRYFAVEMSATGGSSGTFTVKLKKTGGGTVATGNFGVNTGVNKIDWITINPTGSHYYTITNNTSSTISVTLTYYSWP